MTLAMVPELLDRHDDLADALVALRVEVSLLRVEIIAQRQLLADMHDVQAALHAVIERARTANGFVARLLG